MAFIYNLTDTWNSGATTFAGIKMAVTNTASDVGSKLLDLTVSGSTTGSFSVDRTGNGAFSGTLTLAAGSQTSPAVTTTSDTNTGLFFPAADAVAITTGGTERFRVVSSGNVGIGTTNPANGRLQIQGAAGSAAAFLTDNVNSSLHFTFPSASVSFMGTPLAGQNLALGTANTERMRITATGDVGFGTTNPFLNSVSLVRNGNCAYVLGDTSQTTDSKYWDILTTSGALYFRTLNDTNTLSNAFLVVSRGGTGVNYVASALSFRAGNAERLHLDGAGNIGIGTNSFGTSAVRVLALANGTAPTTSPAGIGQLYVEGGALKYRGSSGTVTTIASA